jgi:cytoskeletal protein CcmA (bactofilin family)
MSEITYISKEVSVVEGVLTAEDSKVVVAGSFSGNINANEVILEEGSKFEGEVDARIIVIEGDLKGKVKSYQLKVSHTAGVDGELLTNSIEVASGAEIAGSISRVS